jgi:hypothetical protein
MASPSLDGFKKFMNMKKLKGNPVLLEFVADLHIARRYLRQLVKTIGVGRAGRMRHRPANPPSCCQSSSISFEHTTSPVR